MIRGRSKEKRPVDSLFEQGGDFMLRLAVAISLDTEKKQPVFGPHVERFLRRSEPLQQGINFSFINPLEDVSGMNRGGRRQQK